MAIMLNAEQTAAPADVRVASWWRVLAIGDHPLWSALLAVAVYTIFAVGDAPALWRSSQYAYFNNLADAFNHGQLYLRTLPTTTHDLSYWNGNYYLYWPPFPAVLLMPFVALFGVQFSDILFTLAIAGVNVALVALLLRRATDHGIVTLDAVERGLLVLFFAFGTVHVTLAPYGRVWFTAQLVGFAAVALAYLAALSMRGTWAFVCAGIAMAAALTTRNHLVFVGVWPAIYLLVRHWHLGWRRVLVYVLDGLVPVVIAVGLLGLYNAARFGSIADNGLAYHQMSSFFRADYDKYGPFSLHYLPTNLYYQYIFYPLPFSAESALGGSLFLLSPPFFGARWAVVRGKPRWSTVALVLSVLLPAVPILLLMGTGWVQWGPRYTLDFGVPLLLLTAIGVQRWSRRVLLLLTLIAIAHYLVGTVYLSGVS